VSRGENNIPPETAVKSEVPDSDSRILSENEKSMEIESASSVGETIVKQEPDQSEEQGEMCCNILCGFPMSISIFFFTLT